MNLNESLDLYVKYIRFGKNLRDMSKNVINKYFYVWISNLPESYHWKDMQRFYDLVWSICRYGRKPRDQQWLKEKINEREHNLTEEDIEYYCDLFYQLQVFYKYIRGINT